MASVQTTGSVGTARRWLAFRLDYSWLPAGALLLWWMATLTIPSGLRDQPTLVYWLLAAALVVGFLLSVIGHEIGHALAARRYGTPSETTLLYPFGGVRDRDMGLYGAEGGFLVSLAGPVASATTAFVLMVLAETTVAGTVPRVLLNHLAALNALLAAINLLPAFPLDGGRALRDALWALRGDFVWATGVSQRLGGTFGLLAIGVGILIILSNGTPVVGIAFLLLGFTVRAASAQAYRHMVTRSSLEGVPVSQFMNDNPITIQRAMSISALAEDFIYKHHLSMLPVVDGDRLLGYVTAQRVKEMPRDEWSRQSIGTIVVPFSTDNTISPDTEAVEALDKMTRTGNSRLMVVEEGRLEGVVALQDLANQLQAAPLPESGTN